MAKPELVYVNTIKTTPERLWRALTDPEFTRRCWCGMRMESDWNEGSPGWRPILANLVNTLEGAGQ